VSKGCSVPVRRSFRVALFGAILRISSSGIDARISCTRGRCSARVANRGSNRTRTSDVAVPDRPAATGLAQATPGLAGPVLARSTLVGSPSAPEPQTFVANGELIRDARLDRYLAAHKQFAGSTALGVPSGFLRNATAEAVGR